MPRTTSTPTQGGVLWPSSVSNLTVTDPPIAATDATNKTYVDTQIAAATGGGPAIISRLDALELFRDTTQPATDAAQDVIIGTKITQAQGDARYVLLTTRTSDLAAQAALNATYLTSAALTSYYTKSEIDTLQGVQDAAIALKANTSDLANYYTKTQVDTSQATQDAAIALKANTSDLANYVLGSALTTTLGNYVLSSTLSSTLANYYTSNTIDTLLGAKANAADVYSAAASDATFQTITGVNALLAPINTSITGLDSRVTTLEGHVYPPTTSITTRTSGASGIIGGTCETALASLKGQIDALVLGSGGLTPKQTQFVASTSYTIGPTEFSRMSSYIADPNKWAYLDGINQNLSTTSEPTFRVLNFQDDSPSVYQGYIGNGRVRLNSELGPELLDVWAPSGLSVYKTNGDYNLVNGCDIVLATSRAASVPTLLTFMNVTYPANLTTINNTLSTKADLSLLSDYVNNTTFSNAIDNLTFQLIDKADLTYVNGNFPDYTAFNNAWAAQNALNATYLSSSTSYTKTEIDAANAAQNTIINTKTTLSAVSAYIAGENFKTVASFNTDIANYYTSATVNALLSTKANSSTLTGYYTKTETDALVSNYSTIASSNATYYKISDFNTFNTNYVNLQNTQDSRITALEAHTFPPTTTIVTRVSGTNGVSGGTAEAAIGTLKGLIDNIVIGSSGLTTIQTSLVQSTSLFSPAESCRLQSFITSPSKWGFIDSVNQHVSTGSNVTFGSITTPGAIAAWGGGIDRGNVNIKHTVASGGLQMLSCDTSGLNCYTTAGVFAPVNGIPLTTWLNQSVRTTASPTFANLNFTGYLLGGIGSGIYCRGSTGNVAFGFDNGVMSVNDIDGNYNGAWSSNEILLRNKVNNRRSIGLYNGIASYGDVLKVFNPLLADNVTLSISDQGNMSANAISCNSLSVGGSLTIGGSPYAAPAHAISNTDNSIGFTGLARPGWNTANNSITLSGYKSHANSAGAWDSSIYMLSGIVEPSFNCTGGRSRCIMLSTSPVYTSGNNCIVITTGASSNGVGNNTFDCINIGKGNTCIANTAATGITVIGTGNDINPSLLINYSSIIGHNNTLSNITSGSGAASFVLLGSGWSNAEVTSYTGAYLTNTIALGSYQSGYPDQQAKITTGKAQLAVDTGGNPSSLRSPVYFQSYAQNNCPANSFVLLVSARKYKENITYDVDVNEFDKLKPCHYNLKGGGPREIGFIADDSPEDFIIRDKDGEIESLDYSRVCCLLTQKIKVLEAEHKQKIDSLESRLAALEALMRG